MAFLIYKDGEMEGVSRKSVRTILKLVHSQDEEHLENELKRVKVYSSELTSSIWDSWCYDTENVEKYLPIEIEGPSGIVVWEDIGIKQIYEIPIKIIPRRKLKEDSGYYDPKSNDALCQMLQKYIYSILIKGRSKTKLVYKIPSKKYGIFKSFDKKADINTKKLALERIIQASIRAGCIKEEE
jgi:hypothetical protein